MQLDPDKRRIKVAASHSLGQHGQDAEASVVVIHITCQCAVAVDRARRTIPTILDVELFGQIFACRTESNKRSSPSASRFDDWSQQIPHSEVKCSLRVRSQTVCEIVCPQSTGRVSHFPH